MNATGYQDLTIRIPADPIRPAISEIVLDLGERNGQLPLFKLDRLIVR